MEEYYKTKTPIEDAVDWAKKMETKYHIGRFYGDPSSPDLLYKFNSEGFSMSPANNAVLPGINTVFNCFEIRDDKLPRIFILKSCENVIYEVQEYRYREVGEEKAQKEDQFQGKDHLMDAIRYALHSHERNSQGFSVLSDPEGLVF